MRSIAPVLAVFSASLGFAACSNANDVNPPSNVDAGSTPDGGGSDAGVAPGGDGGGLKPFAAPADPGGGGVLFAASGEVLALTGYAFPPKNAGDPAFVDGWAVTFTHLLVTVDHIKLSDNADMNPGDQSQTGALVAEVDGPWAIDLAYGDPSYLPGKGGPGEQAVPIAALSKASDGSALKTDGTRYAFGFDAIAATTQAMNVNLDADAAADYAEMAQNQCVVFYVGTATFKGTDSDPNCNSDAEYEDWPKTVDFRFCFKSPTTYVNCQNPDNDPAKPLGSEEHERGIALQASKSVIGQVTFHTDHPFWDSVLHDSPAHFDQFAAQVAGQDAGTPTVTLEMTKGRDYTAMTDAHGNKLNWRYCVAPPTDVHAKFTGAMAFDPQSVPHATGGDPKTGLRDYYDYTTYDQSTQGHLNSNGLCFVQRNYDSPK